MVQLREKEANTKTFLQKALRLKNILAPYQVPLLINDRIDVALAAQADGVHIGQSDMPYPIARRLMGTKAIIGLSVETMEQLEEAQQWDVDYLGVGTIFPTPTKTDTQIPWGLDKLSIACQKSKHPVVAIGGINAGNLADIVAAGASGAAVVSAICSAENPLQATQQMAALFHP